MSSSYLPQPHGGRLIDRVLKGKKKARAEAAAKDLPQISIDEETVRELENIANGVFSPLEGYMVQEEYLNVLERRSLTNGLPWTIPIVFDVSKDIVKELKEGDDVVLIDSRRRAIALLHIEEIYGFDRRKMSESVFGTDDVNHPGVAKIYCMNERLLGGKIDLINTVRSPFQECTLTPSATRSIFEKKGWRTVVGFQTRNVPHIGHECLQKTALSLFDGLFINPVIGRKKKGDFKDEVILEAYRVLIDNYYPRERVVFGVLQMEMRYAGPKEAIFHAIVRKNFGCTHFIVGRDHAGVGNYYAPYAAQEAFAEFPDLGITPIFFPSFYYCRRCLSIVNEKTCPHDLQYHLEFSGTRIRESLITEGKVDSDLLRPEVGKVISKWRDPFIEEPDE